jgi:hypothetical protein
MKETVPKINDAKCPKFEYEQIQNKNQNDLEINGKNICVCVAKPI